MEGLEKKVSEVNISQEQYQELDLICQTHPSQYKARAARIVILYASGLPTGKVAQLVGLSRSRVRFWRRKFSQVGMDIFSSTQPDTSRIVVNEKLIALPPEEEKGSKTILDVNQLTNGDLAVLAEKKSPGLTPDDILAEAGRKNLRFNFYQMLLHESGTLSGENIEDLHDMRVATRRMRAAFDVFGEGFESKATKPLLKGMRKTGQALGSVRDIDVFIEKAKIYIQIQLEGNEGELRALTDTWKSQREQNRTKMLLYLNSEIYRNFKQQFFSFVSKEGAGIRKTDEGLMDHGQIRYIAPVIIYSRLAAVREFEPFIENASIQQLHALRIEFKKFRYTLEFFREILGKEINKVIGELKNVQDYLGNLHDAQVATQILRDFLSQWDANQDGLPVNERRSPDPLIAYLSSKYRERQELFEGFQPVWDRFNRAEIRQMIALSVGVL
jgi:CHAD domain-containing protein